MSYETTRRKLAALAQQRATTEEDRLRYRVAELEAERDEARAAMAEGIAAARRGHEELIARSRELELLLGDAQELDGLLVIEKEKREAAESALREERVERQEMSQKVVAAKMGTALCAECGHPMTCTRHGADLRHAATPTPPATPAEPPEDKP